MSNIDPISLRKLWQSYLTGVINKDACDTQIFETKMAFYGGATALYTMIESFTNKERTDSEMTEFFLSVNKELTNYREQLVLEEFSVNNNERPN